MKKLSIITINYNNAEGLRKTLASVASQTYRDIEHIIIDGGSSDGSVDVIREYESTNRSCDNPLIFIWSSEPDNGIYNAMNKGIRKAAGEYVWILNSGDCVGAEDTVERMMNVIKESSMRIPVLMGNILHIYSDGRKSCKKKQQPNSALIPKPIDASMFTFYRGTIPHDAAFVRRDLFEKYGLFDETMKICADWKLYLNMIALGDVVPMYVNLDVVLFDMSGISNVDNECLLAERRLYMEQVLPPSILKDYDRYGEDIAMAQRLHRHPWAFRMTWFLERVLFKFEKWSRS